MGGTHCIVCHWIISPSYCLITARRARNTRTFGGNCIFVSYNDDSKTEHCVTSVDMSNMMTVVTRLRTTSPQQVGQSWTLQSAVAVLWWPWHWCWAAVATPPLATTCVLGLMAAAVVSVQHPQNTLTWPSLNDRTSHLNLQTMYP